MLKIIGEMLKKEDVTFTMLTGKVPVKKRQALIKEFEDNDDCKIFLSSESGGAGLNLQVADTVINFEIPWNPAKKNQRIGRIDRIGQKKQKLHVFNLLSLESIEMKIATGLLLKQNLFEGVLNEGNLTDEVDFSEKGKSQFIKQLEEVINDNSHDDTIISEDVFIASEETEFEELVSSNQDELPLVEPVSTVEEEKSIPQTMDSQQKIEKMEEVMTKGMEFLTGLYQMSTSEKTTNTSTPKVKVDKETGEVSISFKMEFVKDE